MSHERLPDFTITPLRVEFMRPDIELEFQRHHLVLNRSLLRAALLFCAAFYMVFSITDFIVLGDAANARTLLVARMFMAATALGGLFALYRYPLSVSIPVTVATIVEVVGMGSFMLIAWHRPPEMAWHGMSMCIMLLLIYVFIPNRLMNAIVVALAASVSFVIVAVDLGRMSSSDVLTMSLLLLLVNSFGIIAARRYHRLWREEFRAQSILKDLSIRDHLTGCYNRRYLHESLLEIEIVRARRHHHALAVMVCDIDLFKTVNDTYGHQSGDTVLHHAAQILLSMTRQHIDSVVRYGGEEFLLVLPQTDLAGAVELAERLRVAIASHPAVDGEGREISITASFGVAATRFSSATNRMNDYMLIAAADQYLYDAKLAGRNTVIAGELVMESSPIAEEAPATRMLA